MNIVYMGTPDFAVPTLEMLAASGHEVSLVVTKPDRPAKRGNKVLASPVKIKAVELGIPVSQPEQIKGNMEFFNQITDAAPDLIVVAAYGKLLPLDILEIPTFGAVNIHASLLPRFRGAAPIHRAVLAGDKETGVTLMYMSEGMDEGDMLAVSSTEIDHKNTGQLHDELAAMGAELLSGKLEDIENSSIDRIKQDDEFATYAPMIEKEEGHLDFTKDGEYLERQIRAMTPFPGAFANIDDKKMKIIEAYPGLSQSEEIPGTILKVNNEGIEVKSGNSSSLIITKLQMPGKKAMDTASFLRGNKLEEGRLLR